MYNPIIAVERLHRLRPSDVNRIRNALDRPDGIVSIVSTFVEYLKNLNSSAANDLDDAARISLQLKKAGLWGVIDPRIFADVFEHAIEKPILDEVSSSLFPKEAWPTNLKLFRESNSEHYALLKNAITDVADPQQKVMSPDFQEKSSRQTKINKPQTKVRGPVVQPKPLPGRRIFNRLLEEIINSQRNQALLRAEVSKKGNLILNLSVNPKRKQRKLAEKSTAGNLILDVEMPSSIGKEAVKTSSRIRTTNK